MRLNQTIRNLTCGDLEISLVVIQLGVTRLKKTGFMYLLFRGMRGERWCDLMCVERLEMIGLMVVLLRSFSRMMSTVLALWGAGAILGNGYGI